MSLTVPAISTLVTELTDELGENSSDSTVTARIERWLNEVFEDILSRRDDWKWARDYKELILSPGYSTGTVQVTQNSTTVLGTGTSWDSSWVHRIFWVSGSGVNYKVASITNATTLVLETAFQEASASGASYQLAQDGYVLDNQAYESGIVQVINPYSDDPLEEIDIEDLLRIYPKRREFGEPTMYAMWGQAATTETTNPSGPLIYFDKFPSVARQYTYFFHKQFARISGSSTFPLPPKFYRQILTYGCKVKAAEFDEAQKQAEAKYEGLIQLMIQENSKSGDRIRGFRETDVPLRRRGGVRLPAGYPDLGDY